MLSNVVPLLAPATWTVLELQQSIMLALFALPVAPLQRRDRAVSAAKAQTGRPKAKRNRPGPFPFFLGSGNQMTHAASRPSLKPFLPGISPTVRVPLSNGDRGTEQTIAKIRKLVHEGMTDQLVNRTAVEIVQRAGV